MPMFCNPKSVCFVKLTIEINLRIIKQGPQWNAGPQAIDVSRPLQTALLLIYAYAVCASRSFPHAKSFSLFFPIKIFKLNLILMPRQIVIIITSH